MAISVRIDGALGLARLEAEGPVGAADVVAAVETLIATPGYRPRMDALWDFRGAVLDTLTADEMKALSLRMAGFPERHGAKVALVVAGDLEFGIIRMWAAYADTHFPQERQVFRELDAALAWLRPPADPPGAG